MELVDDRKRNIFCLPEDPNNFMVVKWVEDKYRTGRFGKTYIFNKQNNSLKWIWTVIVDIAYTLTLKFPSLYDKIEYESTIRRSIHTPFIEYLKDHFTRLLLAPLESNRWKIKKSILFVLDLTRVRSFDDIDPVAPLIMHLLRLPPMIRFLILGVEKGFDGFYRNYAEAHAVPLIT